MIQLDKIIHLGSALERKRSQIKQNMSVLIGMQKPPKDFKMPFFKKSPF